MKECPSEEGGLTPDVSKLPAYAENEGLSPKQKLLSRPVLKKSAKNEGVSLRRVSLKE